MERTFNIQTLCSQILHMYLPLWSSLLSETSSDVPGELELLQGKGLLPIIQSSVWTIQSWVHGMSSCGEASRCDMITLHYSSAILLQRITYPGDMVYLALPIIFILPLLCQFLVKGNPWGVSLIRVTFFILSTLLVNVFIIFCRVVPVALRRLVWS